MIILSEEENPSKICVTVSILTMTRFQLYFEIFVHGNFTERTWWEITMPLHFSFEGII